MSDLSDVDRGRRRKKKINRKSDRESDLMPGKTPIILAKPPAETATIRASSAEAVRFAVPKPITSSETLVPITRILKSRDDSARSLSTPALAANLNTLTVVPHSIDDEISFISTAAVNPTPKIQIQQKSASNLSVINIGLSGTSSAPSTPQVERGAGLFESSSLEQRLASYPEMKGSVKLIDEALQWCDHISEFMQDQCDFLVVGVLGLQSVGKSMVMSLLSGKHGLRPTKNGVFKMQTKDQCELGEHSTKGVDIFVTNHRIILLDVQPMLSPSVMDHMIQFEKKFPSEYSSTENALEIQSLQLAAFLMTVCHVVVLVQDWFTDPNLLRFVQTAEMLRPSALLPGHDGTGSSEESTEYFPHFVLVQNKCSPFDFKPSQINVMQQTYSHIFAKSKLKFRALTAGGISLSSKLEKPINLFLLPLLDFQVSDFFDSLPASNGKPCFEDLAKLFRRHVNSMPRSHMLHTSLSEKNWLHYAARTWENVKKSGLFMEYCRLLA